MPFPRQLRCCYIVARLAPYSPKSFVTHSAGYREPRRKTLRECVLNNARGSLVNFVFIRSKRMFGHRLGKRNRSFFILFCWHWYAATVRSRRTNALLALSSMLSRPSSITSSFRFRSAGNSSMSSFHSFQLHTPSAGQSVQERVGFVANSFPVSTGPASPTGALLEDAEAARRLRRIHPWDFFFRSEVEPNLRTRCNARPLYSIFLKKDYVYRKLHQRG